MMRCPARGWCHRQILRIARLVQACGIDVGEGVLKVQRLHRVDIRQHLPTPQAGITPLVLIDFFAIQNHAFELLQEDIVVYMVGKE